VTRNLPSPGGHWLFGHQPAYAVDPLGSFRRWHEEHGDAVSLRFGPQRVLLLTSPGAAEAVLMTQADAFRKAPVMRRLAGPVIGDSLFTSEGEQWRRQRELLEGWFAGGGIERQLPTIAGHVQGMADGLTEERPVALLDATMRFCQRLIATVLFGAELTSRDASRIAAALAITADDFQRRLNSPLLLLPGWLPYPGRGRLRQAVEELDEIVFRLIRSRRQRGRGSADLLAMMLDRQAEFPWLTDKLIRDNVLMLLVQGREDPALLLTWSLYLVAGHPEVGRRLRAESEAFLDDEPATPEVLSRLQLSSHVLKEALRLYPPVYSTGRVAVHDCVVDGVRVRRGTVVLLSQAVTHRDARWYNDPDEFRPDRWESGLQERLPVGAFAPFGLGPRRCLGEGLAMTIAHVALAMLARSHAFERAETDPVQPTVALSLRPEREVLLNAQAVPENLRPCRLDCR
jgi:cytochrome P450